MADMDDLVDSVKELLAMSFIGFGLATTFYGITILQTYLYYRNYPSDGAGLKITVATLFILDTLCSIFVGHTLYTYYVLNFGKDPLSDVIMPWSFTAERLSAALITLIAQGFYARTIWKASEGFLIAFLVGMIAVVTFGLGVETTVHLFEDPDISARSFQILSGMVQGLAALNDVLIAVCLCAWLYRQKAGTGGWRVGQAFAMGKLVDTLILYIITGGVLTAPALLYTFLIVTSSVTQMIFLSLNLRYPDETYWIPWHVVVAKIFVNSILAMLNVRHTFAPADDLPTKGEVTGSGTSSGRRTAVTGAGLKSLVFNKSAASSGTDSVDLTTGNPSERVSEEKETV